MPYMSQCSAEKLQNSMIIQQTHILG